MKTSSKSLAKCRVQLEAVFEAEEAKEIISDVEKVFCREASIPGFRKGKVPLGIIKKEFASQLKEEYSNKLMSKYFVKAIKAEDIKLVEIAKRPEISIDENSAKFVVEVDVDPEFKLPAYKGLKISKESTEVSDDELNNTLADIRSSFAKYEEAPDGYAIKEGDFVQIDYKGTVDGKDILDLDKDAKFVAGSEGYWLQVKEGYFLPEILDALKGMKSGESKNAVKVKFDKTLAPESLKGKKASYDITVKTVRQCVLPTDEQFVEQMKAESLESLKEKCRENLTERKVKAEESRRKDEAFELLMKKVDFEVPQTLVERHSMMMLEEHFNRLPKNDAKVMEEVKKNLPKLTEEARKEATRIVRFSYVASEIAKAENIECKQEEMGEKVIEFIIANAKN